MGSASEALRRLDAGLAAPGLPSSLTALHLEATRSRTPPSQDTSCPSPATPTPKGPKKLRILGGGLMLSTQAKFNAYARMYLREEIQAEALVRNLSGFARFLPVAAVCHGQTTNISNLARDAGVARTTTAGYLQVLEETLLAFHLPAYEARLRVSERAHPKFYFCDSGLVRALRSPDAASAEAETVTLFEGLVEQVLRAYRDYSGSFDHFFYWSSGAGVEVDFLLGNKNRWVAVEVKSGLHPPPDWFRGLKAVKDLPGLVRRIIVRPQGPGEITSSGVEILDLPAFEHELASGHLWTPSER